MNHALAHAEWCACQCLHDDNAIDNIRVCYVEDAQEVVRLLDKSYRPLPTGIIGELRRCEDLSRSLYYSIDNIDSNAADSHVLTATSVTAQLPDSFSSETCTSIGCSSARESCSPGTKRNRIESNADLAASSGVYLKSGNDCEMVVDSTIALEDTEMTSPVIQLAYEANIDCQIVNPGIISDSPSHDELYESDTDNHIGRCPQYSQSSVATGESDLLGHKSEAVEAVLESSFDYSPCAMSPPALLSVASVLSSYPSTIQAGEDRHADVSTASHGIADTVKKTLTYGDEIDVGLYDNDEMAVENKIVQKFDEKQSIIEDIHKVVVCALDDDTLFQWAVQQPQSTQHQVTKELGRPEEPHNRNLDTAVTLQVVESTPISEAGSSIRDRSYRAEYAAASSGSWSQVSMDDPLRLSDWPQAIWERIFIPSSLPSPSDIYIAKQGSVVYWTVSVYRVEGNLALASAMRLANLLRLPIIVVAIVDRLIWEDVHAVNSEYNELVRNVSEVKTVSSSGGTTFLPHRTPAVRSYQRKSIHFMTALRSFREELHALGIPLLATTCVTCNATSQRYSTPGISKPVLKPPNTTASTQDCVTVIDILISSIKALPNGVFAVFTDDSLHPLHERNCLELRKRAPTIPLFLVDSDSIVLPRLARKQLLSSRSGSEFDITENSANWQKKRSFLRSTLKVTIENRRANCFTNKGASTNLNPSEIESQKCVFPHESCVFDPAFVDLFFTHLDSRSSRIKELVLSLASKTEHPHIQGALVSELRMLDHSLNSFPAAYSFALVDWQLVDRVIFGYFQPIVQFANIKTPSQTPSLARTSTVGGSISSTVKTPAVPARSGLAQPTTTGKPFGGPHVQNTAPTRASSAHTPLAPQVNGQDSNSWSDSYKLSDSIREGSKQRLLGASWMRSIHEIDKLRGKQFDPEAEWNNFSTTSPGSNLKKSSSSSPLLTMPVINPHRTCKTEKSGRALVVHMYSVEVPSSAVTSKRQWQMLCVALASNFDNVGSAPVHSRLHDNCFHCGPDSVNLAGINGRELGWEINAAGGGLQSAIDSLRLSFLPTNLVIDRDSHCDTLNTFLEASFVPTLVDLDYIKYKCYSGLCRGTNTNEQNAPIQQQGLTPDDISINTIPWLDVLDDEGLKLIAVLDGQLDIFLSSNAMCASEIPLYPKDIRLGRTHDELFNVIQLLFIQVGVCPRGVLEIYWLSFFIVSLGSVEAGIRAAVVEFSTHTLGILEFQALGLCELILCSVHVVVPHLLALLKRNQITEAIASYGKGPSIGLLRALRSDIEELVGTFPLLRYIKRSFQHSDQ